MDEGDGLIQLLGHGNTISGSLTISGVASIQVGSNAVVAADVSVSQFGGVDITGSHNRIPGRIDLKDGRTMTVAGTGNALSGNLTDADGAKIQISGSLLIAGGSLTLEGNVAISGGTTLQSGAIRVSGPSNAIAGSLLVEAGALTVSGTDAAFTASGPVTLAGGALSASSDGMLSLMGPTSFTVDTSQADALAEVEALSGGDVEMPLLNEVSGGPVYLLSNGAGSTLDLPILTSVQGPAGQDYQTTLEAVGGGSLLAPELSSVGGADVVVEASGTGTTLSLTALATITADTTHANSLSEVEALNGADIELPALNDVSGGPVLFRSNGGGGKLDIGTLKSMVGPAGQDYDTTLQADGGGSLTASDLNTIGGADVVVNASGVGSLVSLPALATITGDTTHANSLTEVEALNGGDVELPALSEVNGGPVLFRSNGTGGELDIGTLMSIVGPAGQDYDTTLQADGGGTLTATDLNTIGGADVVVDASGVGSLVSLPALATITGDTTHANSLTEVERSTAGTSSCPP